MRHDSNRSKDKQRVPCSQYHQLLPIVLQAEWLRPHGDARRGRPERVARCRGQRDDIPFVGASEDEAARGCKQTGPPRRMERKFPHLPSRAHVKRADGARWFQPGDAPKAARAEKVAGMVFRYAKVKASCLLARG